MVVRDYAECTVCGTPLLLRVGIGLEETCAHTFDCPSCFSPLTVEAKTSDPPSAWLECKENCRNVDREQNTSIVINLHPSCAFRADTYHSPFAFPSLEFTNMVGPYMRTPSNSKNFDAAQDFELPYSKQLWPLVNSVLNLVTHGDPAKIQQKQIARYEAKRKEFLPTFTCSTAFKCVASFFDDSFFPLIGDLRQPLRSYISHLRTTHAVELSRFQSYYQANLEKLHLGRSIALFQDYFKNFDQFRQMVAHARIADDDVDDYIVGAKNFSEIKLYYGQAFESLTSSYVTLACLNNIGQGRPFDTFNSMTLAKYINDVEKSKKSNPFLPEPVMASYTRWDDSALRNGSHHAAIVRDGELVKYRSGGTGAERDISYSRYIHMCNAITIANAALMLVELQEFSSAKPI